MRLRRQDLQPRKVSAGGTITPVAKLINTHKGSPEIIWTVQSCSMCVMPEESNPWIIYALIHT